jgi:hypothetical protein
MKALAAYCGHRAKRLLLFGISYEIQSMNIYSHADPNQALCVIQPGIVCPASAR